MGIASGRLSIKALLLLILLPLLLSGCAIKQPQYSEPAAEALPQAPLEPPSSDDDFELEEEFEDASQGSIVDPLGGYNRLMTRVNDKVYFWVLKPTARGYRAVVPESARLAVGRFFRNLLMPVRFTNNLLQFKAQQAGTELVRFVLNSTVGVLGLFDPAENYYGLRPYPEDFGQTLGHYGVGSGFHIVLPLLGPSNLRDAIGLVPDSYLAPIGYVEDSELRLALRAYSQVNHASLHLGEYESLKRDAVDLYPFLRDGYEQRRQKQVEE